MKDLLRIHIVAPAGKADKTQTRKGIKLISGLGFTCLEGKSLYHKDGYFAGNDTERLFDFQTAINDDTLAIWAARGGYGITRIIDLIHWKKFIKNPAWIIGFSDITAIHIYLSNIGIPSIHGPMVSQIADPSYKEEISVLKGIFENKFPEYQLPSHKENRTGKTKGTITGGNLTLITSTIGTASEIITDGKILFIEEVGESAYRIDRMLVQLKRSGKLKKIKGLIVGHMTNISEEKEFGRTVFDIISEHTSEYTFPVCYNFPAGHDKPNMPLILGQQCKLTVEKSTVLLSYL
jgi:muramoyltetrapeptide carboxypeptidase